MISRFRCYRGLPLIAPLLVLIFIAPLLAPFPDENSQVETQVLFPALLFIYGDTAASLILLTILLAIVGFGMVYSAVFGRQKRSAWIRGLIWLLPLLGSCLLCSGTLLRGSLREIQDFQGSTAVYRLVDVTAIRGLGDEYDDSLRIAHDRYSDVYECPYGSLFCRFKHLSYNGSSGQDNYRFPHLEYEPVSGNLYLLRSDEPVFVIKGAVPPTPLQSTVVTTIKVSNAQNIWEIARLIANRPRGVYWLPDSRSFFVEQYPRLNGETGFDLSLYSVAALQSPRHVEFKQPPTPSWRWVGGFSADRSTVAMIGDDAVDVRDTRTGNRLARLGATGWSTTVALSPNGQFLVHASGSNAAGPNSVINVYDLKTMPDLRLVKVAKNPSLYEAALVFSPDGKRIAMAGSGLWIWDFPAFTGQQLDTGYDYSSDRNTIAFSPNGAVLAAGKGGSLNLWDVKTGKKLPVEDRLAASNWIVAFSPDGSILAFADDYIDTIELWDVKTGKIVAELGGYKGDISSLSFSPDGTLLASTSNDGMVRLFGIPSPL
jgi:hypothetical protein